MLPGGFPNKDRQKLMRNLRVIDLLVKLLQCRLVEGDEEAHLIRIFKEAYDVLHAYMIGKTRKNALYFAKYIDFFQTQFTQKGGIGLNVASMIVELIRDKRKIVDRITKSHIDTFIELLRTNQNYRFLDLLQVLCVCDHVAIPNNQTYIVQHWLRTYKDSVYLMDRGQNINKRPNIVYVSCDGSSTWLPLHTFVDPSTGDYNEDQYQYLLHQLELIKAFCFGRNDFAIHVITREFGYVTWEDAFLCIQSELLPDAIRAKFCELIIGLFVDVGNNYSVLDNPNICFVYEYVGSKDSDREQSQYVVKDLVTIFPVLRDWLAEFLNENCTMTASMIGRNLLIEQVLHLLHHLVKFGYYMDLDDVRSLLVPLLSLLDGRHDVPFPKDYKGKSYTKESNRAVAQYRQSGRFETSPEASAVVNAKYQAMWVLDLLLTFQRNLRLKVFVTKFKYGEQSASRKKSQTVLEPLLYETYDPSLMSKKALRKQKEVLKELREMFNASAIFDLDSTTAILLDLSNYKYDKMVVKSLDILNKMYSSQNDMFKLANEAQVLLSHDSARVHREVQRSLPTLRRLAHAKLNEQQVQLMCDVLDELAEFCHLPKTPEEPHHMNQNIMISHGILNIMLEVLSQEIDAKLIEQYHGMEKVFKKTLYVLKLLIRENHKVQDWIFNNLDTLLDVQIVQSDMAIALKEVFIGNQATCLKVHSRQIQRIVLLAAECQDTAPEFLELLKVLVKVEGLDLTIKRNQALVMKYIMQTFKKAAYVLDQDREKREKILLNKMEIGHLTYFVNLVDLLATCAEGENKFIESLCQTILPVEELLWVMNHAEIDANLKKPFIKFMLWVYMKTSGNLVESGAADLQHDKDMWDFICSTLGEINQLTDYANRHPDRLAYLLKTPPANHFVADSSDTRSVMHGSLFYVLDGVMPFLNLFYTVFYSPDKDVYSNEVNTTESLANSLVALCDSMGSMITHPAHMKTMVMCVTTVVSVSNSSKPLLVSVLEKFTTDMKFDDNVSAVRKGNMEYYAAELELNAKFHTFTTNCSKVHRGHNTVGAQIKYRKNKNREYTEIGSNEELPLGEEFQTLVRCFTQPSEKKPIKHFAPAFKLIEQLWISAQNCKLNRKDVPTHWELDVKCLQILRAILHNEERKLPESWELRTAENKIKKHLAYISEVQVAINGRDVIVKVLPHLARRNDEIAREVLAFICLMLFNANRVVQKSMLEYFLSTREEVFFMAVRDRMQISTNSIKEKRSLLAQHEARVKEAMSNMNNYNTTLTIGRKALQQIQVYEQKMKSDMLGGWRALCRAVEPSDDQRIKRKFSWKRKSTSSEYRKMKRKGLLNGIAKDNEALMTDHSEIELSNVRPEHSVMALKELKEQKTEEDMVAVLDSGVKDMLEYKDDGYIELVLKLMARICDGQHQGLQDYLREQPDNVKSFNIVGETAQFLNVVYTTINNKTIDLVIQLFNTLNEFCSGNQENRSSIYDKKVIDYINFILRAGEIADCPLEKVIDLRQAIASLVMSLIEENGPGASQVAKEVKDALDRDAVIRCMTACYEMHQSEKTKFDGLGKLNEPGGALHSAKSIAAFGGSVLQGVVKGKKKNALKEMIADVGFSFYMILARMTDIDIHHLDDVILAPENQRALDYYKKNCSSIEIVKDDVLQKANFRVKNKSVLREEVKEKLKWNVDRSSPSNKIRDLMSWTRDILKDISYQKKILNNPIAKMFTNGWLFWNYGAILLSLAINILMLWTWDAKASMEDCADVISANQQNISGVCPGLNDPYPVITGISGDLYRIIMLSLGGAHILCSLFVLIAYFLSNHPRLPRLVDIKASIKKIIPCQKKETDEELVNKKEERKSNLDVNFFSFTTFYYLMFLGMSIAGILFHGYFFAFHLLNIVNNNQLLGGVIKAVTVNGMSLLWVAVLGFILIYIYSLVGFALLRAYFKPNDYLYCTTLWQCFVTVIRYGLIGDMFEEIKEYPGGSSFSYFWPLVIYHVSFFIFITTIGLNIIFGIIVDTFSELRDLKWRAESDMRDTCFVCSRNSYDFEHHGKGFDFHVRNEHNMWAYMYFIIHLTDVKASDYTALELFVAKLVESESYDFFPLNRALCLSSIDVDSTESKIDDLLAQVNSIAKKQKEDEAEKKRKVEKLKQKRWQEKHRRFMFSGTPYIGDVDSEREPLIPPSRAMSVDPFSRDGSAKRDIRRTREVTPTTTLAKFLAPPQDYSTPKPKKPYISSSREEQDDVEDMMSDSESHSGSESSHFHREGSYDLLDEDIPVRDMAALPPPPPLLLPSHHHHPPAAPESPLPAPPPDTDESSSSTIQVRDFDPITSDSDSAKTTKL
ncbi:inositol 1,4,5-trisphosphate receptor type 1-like [Gigantopelta aegis]|uniref:inositol 1,4,5-trisphosphate receptor type 1-like n=1 Tax=Gigantopelta aegis TaxID=1735272 RepID=UPI001B889D7F|nr:inositol 1,4,5-trisphosphate receptor type 1-like [Gigantopelta aegis]